MDLDDTNLPGFVGDYRSQTDYRTGKYSDRDVRDKSLDASEHGKISFSLYDNLLLDHEQPMIHYRSASLGGSSGSPVFYPIWELIGLHHAGGHEMKKLNGSPGYYGANEGIWIRSIIDNIIAKSGST